MNEHFIRLSTSIVGFALIGALVGYLREGSFIGMLAGAIFFVVICGVVGLLMTDSRSPKTIQQV